MLLDLSVAPPLPPPNLLMSSPLEMTGELECELSFLEHLATVCLLGAYSVAAGNWNAKYITALLPGPSNMFPGCKVAQSLSAEPTPNQDKQDCVLPAE